MIDARHDGPTERPLTSRDERRPAVLASTDAMARWSRALAVIRFICAAAAVGPRGAVSVPGVAYFGLIVRRLPRRRPRIGRGAE
jgi:hypothetical protein